MPKKTDSSSEDSTIQGQIPTPEFDVVRSPDKIPLLEVSSLRLPEIPDSVSDSTREAFELIEQTTQQYIDKKSPFTHGNNIRTAAYRKFWEWLVKPIDSLKSYNDKYIRPQNDFTRREIEALRKEGGFWNNIHAHSAKDGYAKLLPETPLEIGIEIGKCYAANKLVFHTGPDNRRKPKKSSVIASQSRSGAKFSFRKGRFINPKKLTTSKRPRPVINGPVCSRRKDVNPDAVFDALNVEDSQLGGIEISHGTTVDHTNKIHDGPQNMGSGYGGKGLYVAFGKNSSLAKQFAGTATGTGPKGVVLNGTVNPNKSLRHGRIRLAPRNRPSAVDYEKGIFPPNWQKDSQLQRFVHDNFDVLEVVDVAKNGYAFFQNDAFLVFHQSSGKDAIIWDTPSATSESSTEPKASIAPLVGIAALGKVERGTPPNHELCTSTEPSDIDFRSELPPRVLEGPSDVNVKESSSSDSEYTSSSVNLAIGTEKQLRDFNEQPFKPWQPDDYIQLNGTPEGKDNDTEIRDKIQSAVTGSFRQESLADQLNSHGAEREQSGEQIVNIDSGGSEQERTLEEILTDAMESLRDSSFELENSTGNDISIASKFQFKGGSGKVSVGVTATGSVLATISLKVISSSAAYVTFGATLTAVVAYELYSHWSRNQELKELRRLMIDQDHTERDCSDINDRILSELRYVMSNAQEGILGEGAAEYIRGGINHLSRKHQKMGERLQRARGKYNGEFLLQQHAYLLDVERAKSRFRHGRQELVDRRAAKRIVDEYKDLPTEALIDKMRDDLSGKSLSYEESLVLQEISKIFFDRLSDMTAEGELSEAYALANQMHGAAYSLQPPKLDHIIFDERIYGVFDKNTDGDVGGINHAVEDINRAVENGANTQKALVGLRGVIAKKIKLWAKRRNREEVSESERELWDLRIERLREYERIVKGCVDIHEKFSGKSFDIIPASYVRQLEMNIAAQSEPEQQTRISLIDNIRLKNYQGVVDDINQLHEMGVPGFNYELGFAYLKVKQPRNAIDAFEGALLEGASSASELAERNAKIMSQLAELYKTTDQLARGIAFFEQICGESTDEQSSVFDSVEIKTLLIASLMSANREDESLESTATEVSAEDEVDSSSTSDSQTQFATDLVGIAKECRDKLKHEENYKAFTVRYEGMEQTTQGLAKLISYIVADFARNPNSPALAQVSEKALNVVNLVAPNLVSDLLHLVIAQFRNGNQSHLFPNRFGNRRIYLHEWQTRFQKSMRGNLDNIKVWEGIRDFEHAMSSLNMIAGFVDMTTGLMSPEIAQQVRKVTGVIHLATDKCSNVCAAYKVYSALVTLAEEKGAELSISDVYGVLKKNSVPVALLMETGFTVYDYYAKKYGCLPENYWTYAGRDMAVLVVGIALGDGLTIVLKAGQIAYKAGVGDNYNMKAADGVICNAQYAIKEGDLAKSCDILSPTRESSIREFSNEDYQTSPEHMKQIILLRQHVDCRLVFADFQSPSAVTRLLELTKVVSLPGTNMLCINEKRRIPVNSDTVDYVIVHLNMLQRTDILTFCKRFTRICSKTISSLKVSSSVEKTSMSEFSAAAGKQMREVKSHILELLSVLSAQNKISDNQQDGNSDQISLYISTLLTDYSTGDKLIQDNWIECLSDDEVRRLFNCLKDFCRNDDILFLCESHLNHRTLSGDLLNEVVNYLFRAGKVDIIKTLLAGHEDIEYIYQTARVDYLRNKDPRKALEIMGAIPDHQKTSTHYRFCSELVSKIEQQNEVSGNAGLKIVIHAVRAYCLRQSVICSKSPQKVRDMLMSIYKMHNDAIAVDDDYYESDDFSHKIAAHGGICRFVEVYLEPSTSEKDLVEMEEAFIRARKYRSEGNLNAAEECYLEVIGLGLQSAIYDYVELYDSDNWFVEMGNNYQFGLNGFPVNIESARQIYERAGENIEALLALANLSATTQQAIEYYRRALDCQSISPNVRKAIDMKIARALDSLQSDNPDLLIETEMDDAQADHEEIIRLAKVGNRHAQKHLLKISLSPRQQVQIGENCQFGLDGWDVNIMLAVQLYKRAYNSEAKIALATIYMDPPTGSMIKKDLKSAKILFELVLDSMDGHEQEREIAQLVIGRLERLKVEMKLEQRKRRVDSFATRTTSRLPDLSSLRLSSAATVLDAPTSRSSISGSRLYYTQ